MPLTVRDIEATLKTLKRMQNYAERNMDQVPVLQSEEMLSLARNTMYNLYTDFLNSDVSELQPAYNKERSEIAILEKNIDYLQESIENYKEQIEEFEKVNDYEKEFLDSPEDLQNYIDENNEEIQNSYDRIEELQNIINS